MTPTQYKVLEIIDVLTKTKKFSPTHQEVANVAGYGCRQTASNLIDKLVKQGYLTKTILDSRNIFITKKGRKILKGGDINE